jgi:hypothetical protein
MIELAPPFSRLISLNSAPKRKPPSTAERPFSTWTMLRLLLRRSVRILANPASSAGERLHTFAERTFNTNFSIALANPSSSFEEVT